MLHLIGIAVIVSIAATMLCDLIGSSLVMCLGKFHSSNRKKNLFSRIFKSRRTEKAKEGYPTITFDKFLELYAVNPSKWDIYYDNGVKYRLKYLPIRGCDTYYNVETTSLFWETRRDYRRFIKWKAQRELADRNARSKAEYREVLEDIQKDIQTKMAKIEEERKKEFERIEKEREEKLKEFRAAEIKLRNTISGPAQRAITLDIDSKGEIVATASTNTAVLTQQPIVTKEKIEELIRAIMEENKTAGGTY
ncbi:MAG: hypothetical protein II670_12845 [Alphaproteobacteria bacterium]|nr:hypothetical protein [Alphaproteobacteria bacterium]